MCKKFILRELRSYPISDRVVKKFKHSKLSLGAFLALNSSFSEKLENAIDTFDLEFLTLI